MQLDIKEIEKVKSILDSRIPFIYYWVCPNCYEPQREYDKPELGNDMLCPDCKATVEVT